MTPIVAIDTETTGTHPDRQAWEIALIRRDDTGEHTWTFYIEVDLEHADPYGLNIGRFYQRHPLGQWLSNRRSSEPEPSLNPTNPYVTRDVAAGLVARVTHGAHLIGLVPNFDAETLAPLLRWHGYTPAWHYHLIDVEPIAIGWLAHQCQGMARTQCDDPAIEIYRDLIAPPTNSDDLSRACGINPPTDDERHTALGDARWALRWYDALTGGNTP